jgi:hypothetical protein
MLLACAGFAATGCSRARGVQTGSDDAVVVLRTVLEAWQHGQSPQALSEQNPPISVTDQAWFSGAKLEKFEIDEKNLRAAGYDLKFPVKLWLSGGKGNPVPVTYTVATVPAVVVVRDFGG